MIICFNGIDGSGKSYQAQRLVAELQAAGYPAVHVWSGGKRVFRRPLIALGKRLMRKRLSAARTRSAQPNTAADTAYHQYLASTQSVLRHAWLRRLWEHVSLLEHTIEIWFTVVPPLLRKQIVVSDRYLHDSIIRVAVLAGTDAQQLPQRLSSLRWYRVPRPTRSFLIDVPADVAFQRKDDIPAIEYLQRRIPLYHAAVPVLGLQVIDGTASPDDVAAAVWQQVKPLLDQTRSNNHEQPAPTRSL